MGDPIDRARIICQDYFAGRFAYGFLVRFEAWVLIKVLWGYYAAFFAKAAVYAGGAAGG
jgi:hypothetical protein